MRTVAAHEWLNAHSLTTQTKVQAIVDAYKKSKGVYPPDKEEFLKLVPQKLQTDDFDLPIEYDPKSGKVSSRGVKARKAIQVNAVVNNLVTLYKMANGKPPASLAELTRWVRVYYGDPKNPPSQVVVDALGESYDCVNGPLGPISYDPETGRITPPPECDAKTLFKNAQKVLKAAP